MKTIKKGIRYLKDKNYRILINSKLGIYNRLTDEEYLKLIFKVSMGYDLVLDNPQTFNEKLQWLKLHDRKREYTSMVDKLAVREYITNKIGEDYLIPLLGVWENPDEIDFEKLPDCFVLKCNHNSGLGMCICKDKSKINILKVKRELKRGLEQNYYLKGREWPYKNVQRKIIAEQYMEDSILKELRDYKFFCFGGVVKCFKIDFDRFTDHHANYYDVNKNLLDFGEANYPPLPERHITISDNVEKMIEIAELLSKSVPFLRVDLYDVDGKIYFGELSFFPESGNGKFTKKEWDNIMGSWIELPDNKICLQKGNI